MNCIPTPPAYLFDPRCGDACQLLVGPLS